MKKLTSSRNYVVFGAAGRLLLFMTMLLGTGVLTGLAVVNAENKPVSGPGVPQAPAREPTATTDGPRAIDDSGPAMTSDPIAYVGHGAMFDDDGAEIVADRAFVRATQAYYLRRLRDRASEEMRTQFDETKLDLERRGLVAGEDERAFASKTMIYWLASSSSTTDRSIRTHSATLYTAYQELSATQRKTSQVAKDAGFPVLEQSLRDAGMIVESVSALSSSYVSDCLSAGVPTPPTWGSSQWKSNGELTTEFVNPDDYAEVFYYTSSSPRGTCIALPRSSGSNIKLLGIICHGVDTSKACFWDAHDVPLKDTKPISDFRAGDDSDIGLKGNCTNCHAGENPFIIHPDSALDLKNVVPAANWQTKNWYDPLIYQGLPQNPGPTNAMNATVGGCLGCHTSLRLPELSKNSSQFCMTVLNKALSNNGEGTMPLNAPGSLENGPHAKALGARCAVLTSSLCEPSNAKICAQAGGYCEQALSTRNRRHDLCRWPTSNSQTACKGTAGLWTRKSSGFARTWPTAVPSGASGACITQMRNIGGTGSTDAACTANNTAICQRKGGLCEDATATDGSNHQLCRWPNHDSSAKCAATNGIWTAKTNPFARSWLTAVRRDEPGSCITQMRNIGGTRN